LKQRLFLKSARSAPDMLKSDVRSFWDQGSAGEFWAVGLDAKSRFLTEEKSRYQFEPFIPSFADFAAATDRIVLEIGVGMGCDHQQWARARPRRLLGTDLSWRSVAYARERFDLFNLKSDLILADCERLPLASDCVDIVYSWGVMHHTPNTRQAVREAYRVLRPGGTAKIMVYHKWSLTGYMLWMRYGLMRGRPWWGLEYIYANFLESPGTKAYTVNEARQLFGQFSDVRIAIQVNYGDLLQSEVGRRHRGPLLSIAKKLWPRWLIRKLLKRHGLYLLITAVK
jgi:SAM-dependent methyltransferase